MKNEKNTKNLAEADLGSLVYLPIGKLDHHPDNPRKNLGDLSELADSIRKNGIFQNLTVVPAEDRYYVVIGNRRLEAAKLAGLTELPCVVADMSRQQQVITMLSENMQRNDLTIYEQGWGFQLAMDLGETVESIAEKSGFSTHTVKRRTRLAELDQDKLRKVSIRQISISDLDQLNRIENVQVRNTLLDFLGTPNFNNLFRRELEAQNRTKLEQRWRKTLKDAGLKELDYYKEVLGGSKYRMSKRHYVSGTAISPADYVRAEDEEFFALNYGSVHFRRTATEEERKKATKDSVAQRERLYAKERMNEITARMYHLRRDFVFSIPETQAKVKSADVIEFILRHNWDNRMEEGYWGRYQRERFTKKKIDFQKGYSQIQQEVSANPFQSLWRHAYVLSADYESLGYVDYMGQYQKNGRLDLIYEMLSKMGYEMCDEEKQLQDGSHKLFQKEEK